MAYCLREDSEKYYPEVCMVGFWLLQRAYEICGYQQKQSREGVSYLNVGKSGNLLSNAPSEQ